MLNAVSAANQRTASMAGDLDVVEARGSSQAADWDTFVSSQPNGSFYHLYGWGEINEAALGHSAHYLLAHDGQRIHGALPLTLVSSRLFGRIMCSMPFVNFGGPCSTGQASEQALLAAAMKLADDRGADYLELRCAAPLETSLPVSHRKISMQIDLCADPDEVWNGFSSKHRTAIRRSYKNELEVYSGGVELLPIFYGVMEQSWRALGTPLYSRSYFERVMRTFPDATRIFVCHRNKEPIAVAFNGYSNGAVEGMWAGGGALARSLQANYVLYWEMIKDACLRGCTRYHLGRSTADSGAEDFKKKWNARVHQLHWYFYRPHGGPMPELNVANPKFRAAIAAWRRLPLWATRLLGPPIARLIP